MKLSTRARYGLKALIDLGLHSANEAISLQSIAERQDISTSYLEQLMAMLKKAGLVKHAGFSFHGTPPVLERILDDNPWVEFVQLQINYLDWDCKNIRSGECYRI